MRIPSWCRPSPGDTLPGSFGAQDGAEELMLWESVIGIVVFSILVLFIAPEWWSSSMGTLKERDRKEKDKEKESKSEDSRSDK